MGLVLSDPELHTVLPLPGLASLWNRQPMELKAPWSIFFDTKKKEDGKLSEKSFEVFHYRSLHRFFRSLPSSMGR